MALKVELKPHERVIVGTAVITNGDSRIRFYVDGDVPILREKDILTPGTADTPAKTIYLAVQLMYLSPENAPSPESYFSLVNAFLAAAPSALPAVSDINELVLGGEYYKALRAARALVAYEKDLLGHAQRGSERLRADGEGRPDAPGAGSLAAAQGRLSPAIPDGGVGPGLARAPRRAHL